MRTFHILLLLMLGLTSTTSYEVRATAPQQAPVSPPTLELVRILTPESPHSLVVELRIRGAARVAGVEFDAVFDRSQLQFAELRPMPFLGRADPCNRASQRCATVLGPLEQTSSLGMGIYTVGTGAGASGDGALAQLIFHTTAPGGTDLTLSLEGTLLASDIGSGTRTSVGALTTRIPFRIMLPITIRQR